MRQTRAFGHTRGKIRCLGGVNITTNTDLWTHQRWDQVPSRSKHPLYRHVTLTVSPIFPNPVKVVVFSFGQTRCEPFLQIRLTVEMVIKISVSRFMYSFREDWKFSSCFFAHLRFCKLLDFRLLQNCLAYLNETWDKSPSRERSENGAL
jgi:hypothetical protein